ncbi:MAG: penicillin-binding protein 1C, partial [Pseudomonadota bacterium]|nr:penicillin-binding protein 1C [Pseudomonadota bacterium]
VEHPRGASTISMQLARRLYHLPTRSPAGKARQILAALWLEARYSKREILEAYLNLAPYGGNIEGAASASLIYFHKTSRQLSLPEVLTLAVIPQNPRKRGVNAVRQWSPALLAARTRLWREWSASHPDALRYRQQMAAPESMYGTSALPFLAPHFTDQLLSDRVSGQVTSSLDLPMQTTLERILTQFVASQRGQGVDNASAMVIDRVSGEVRALVGSADYANAAIDGQVNGTQAKRSPGSTLKPFIYGLALDQGLLHPLTILKDAPTSFGPFSPENFDGRFVGPISAQEALIHSRNIPAVALAERLKQPSLYGFLRSAGVTRLASEHHYGLALALGGGEVTMEELARLYLMLANRGSLRPLSYLALASTPPEPGVAPQLLSPQAAFITDQMLRANARPDTGEPAYPAVAWKTGTSWGFRDAWTAGIFDRYVMLVWVGHFNGESNPAFVGIKTAAPLFFRLVDSLRAQHLSGSEPRLALPDNVSRIEVCTASGDLPNALCKDRSLTWFIPGVSPIRVSSLHRAVKIDRRTGRATCSDGPEVEMRVFEYWPTDLQRLFREAGMPRQTPPPVPDCGADHADLADAPQIRSPSRGAVYTLRLSSTTPILLRADVTGAQEGLFWFANNGLIGQSHGGDALGWRPRAAGTYQLRVIDRQGRSDSREVVVEFVP